jgi:hypothetical protein
LPAAQQRAGSDLNIQANFCRRRHQTRTPPAAKIRPGSPAPMIGVIGVQKLHAETQEEPSRGLDVEAGVSAELVATTHSRGRSEPVMRWHVRGGR